MSDPHPVDGLPRERVRMLLQPLTTEDGFLNEACLRELEGALRSMPETHERLAGDPEWSTPAWTTDIRIVGALADSAMQCFGGPPPDLAEVVGYTLACLRSGPFRTSPVHDRRFAMARLSLCEINRLLWEYLGDLPQFTAWNDCERHENWVDLSAVLHNVCISIRNERRHNYAFDTDFEERWARENGE